MHPSDEAAIILDALSFLWPSRDEIVGWCDRQIGESREVADWLVKLSTMTSPRLEDYISVLRANASDRCLTTDEKILMCIDCYDAGEMDLPDTLGALNSIWLGDASRGITVKLDPPLEEVVSLWEQVDGHGDAIPADLEASANRAFAHFREVHTSLENPLPGLKFRTGQQGGGGDRCQRPRFGC
jgi:hypothetical protein